ncbi:MAG: hypothetical protein ACKVP5_17230, partial [Aestuariivirga sp.]
MSAASRFPDFFGRDATGCQPSPPEKKVGRPIAAPLSFQYMTIFLFVNRKAAAAAQRVQSR